eukprot:TRINITY_DN55299_c0_g2_i1.p1 TRINITY_DN55299_c0_g2~~TRINITY_DN55299_c0_g2_i1.p1  ORF type:complete len:141 (+),score=12.09 TRINITY_DN55299_c0_g2_i1:61-483(+)
MCIRDREEHRDNPYPPLRERVRERIGFRWPCGTRDTIAGLAKKRRVCAEGRRTRGVNTQHFGCVDAGHVPWVEPVSLPLELGPDSCTRHQRQHAHEGGGEWHRAQISPVLCVDTLSLIHISEPTRLLSISYAVFCLKKKK